HNKYHKIALPSYLGFFGGSRFVPIITAIASIILGVIMFFIWPTIQGWIFGVGGIVDKKGVIGIFFFGFLLRLLGLFGFFDLLYFLFGQRYDDGFLVLVVL